MTVPLEAQMLGSFARSNCKLCSGVGHLRVVSSPNKSAEGYRPCYCAMRKALKAHKRLSR